MELQLPGQQQPPCNLAVKGRKPRRGEAARLAQHLPPLLVQIDKHVQGRIELLAILDRSHHGPAGCKQVAIGPAELLAVALGNRARNSSQVLGKTSRQVRAGALSC